MSEAIASETAQGTTHVYATRGNVLLRAIVHRASDAAEAAPAIVLFYGGGWRNGDLDQFRPQCERFAARGVVAIRAEYRIESRHGTSPLEAIADARSAMRWVRANAAVLGIDAERIAAGGGSAGGHVAACCALISGFDDAGDDLAISCRPAALVLFNPVLDTGPNGFGHDRFAGRGIEASPLHHVTSGAPPTLVQHGTDDEAVPIEMARAFRDAMVVAGNRCELIEYANRRHGFFNAGRGGPGDHQATTTAAETFLETIGMISASEARR